MLFRSPIGDVDQMRRTYNRARWSVFVLATLGYGLYYVCRLSLNVIKKPIVDAWVLTETELGVMGSALFITFIQLVSLPMAFWPTVVMCA